MICLIRIRDDYPEETAEWNDFEYQKLGWYTVCVSPYKIPRSIFEVQVREVKAGDKCPDCGEGKLDHAFKGHDFDEEIDFLWCEHCGALDEDHWWAEIKFRISWRGSGEKALTVST